MACCGGTEERHTPKSEASKYCHKKITLRFMHVRSALRFVSIGVHVQSTNTNNNQLQGQDFLVG